jgi:hypothetical protein
MLYIGHFSYDELGAEQKPRHGYFTGLVEAENADHAVSEFEDLIGKLKNKNKLFHRIVAVYIEDIIEIKDIPRKAIITRIQSSAGEFPKSISHSLPEVGLPGIAAYGWAPDVKKIREGGDSGYQEMVPFIKF